MIIDQMLIIILKQHDSVGIRNDEGNELIVENDYVPYQNK